MIRVKLNTSMAGVGFHYRRGQEVEMDDATALRLIASKQAVHVIPAETAVSPEWPQKRISPAKYLEKYPDGPNADLARKCLGIASTEVR